MIYLGIFLLIACVFIVGSIGSFRLPTEPFDPSFADSLKMIVLIPFMILAWTLGAAGTLLVLFGQIRSWQKLPLESISSWSPALLFVGTGVVLLSLYFLLTHFEFLTTAGLTFVDGVYYFGLTLLLSGLLNLGWWYATQQFGVAALPVWVFLVCAAVLVVAAYPVARIHTQVTSQTDPASVFPADPTRRERLLESWYGEADRTLYQVAK